MIRIYQASDLNLHQRIRLHEKPAHHLIKVLRSRVGDEFLLFNGEGGEYHAVIRHIDKKSVEVELTQFIERDVESGLNIHLAQGISRGEKMDWIIQKAVELGVSKITPLITERCNVRLDAEREAKRLEHWQAVAISAAEQSGRTRVPHIFAPAHFADWYGQVEADEKWVLSPHVSAPFMKTQITPASVVMVVGPEGGLSDKEVALPVGAGFKPLSLGPRILRTETAPVVMLGILQYCYGDFC